MSLLLPTIFVDKVTDISVELLKQHAIKVIFLDIDETITKHDSTYFTDDIVNWILTLKSEGFSLIIVSNNFKKRVIDIANRFSLPFLSYALKPLPFFFIRAKKRFKIKTPNNQCMIIGDQIFTDILGGNICRIKSALTEPINNDGISLSLKFKRKLEKQIKHKIKSLKNNKI